jgi:hypothetical protein
MVASDSQDSNDGMNSGRNRLRRNIASASSFWAIACDQAMNEATSIWIWREAIVPCRPADARRAADSA